MPFDLLHVLYTSVNFLFVNIYIYVYTALRSIVRIAWKKIDPQLSAMRDKLRQWMFYGEDSVRSSSGVHSLRLEIWKLDDKFCITIHE